MVYTSVWRVNSPASVLGGHTDPFGVASGSETGVKTKISANSNMQSYLLWQPRMKKGATKSNVFQLADTQSNMWSYICSNTSDMNYGQKLREADYLRCTKWMC